MLLQILRKIQKSFFNSDGIINFSLLATTQLNGRFYEAEGIKVEIRSAFQDGIILDGPTEINEGRADFGVGAANILMAQDSGIDLTLVASIFQRSAVEYCTLLNERGNTVLTCLNSISQDDLETY